MAKAIKLTYGEETSVRVEDYKYIKPRLEVTASIEDGETFDEALEKVKAVVRERLGKIEREIYKREKEKRGKK